MPYKIIILKLLGIYLLGVVLVASLSQLDLYPKPSKIKPLIGTIAARETTKQDTLVLPQQITIPAVGIDLTVAVTSQEADGLWPVSKTKAHFIASTSPLMLSGNSVIYGHNTKAVFLKTRSLKPGDLAYLKGDNGLVYIYKYRSSKLVDADDASILAEQPTNHQLVLLTCNGWRNQQRKLIYFDYSP